jgi:hypothetical protein
VVELYWKVTIGYNPRYSADFFLLKELIQNADDARSSSVVIALTVDRTPVKKSYSSVALQAETVRYSEVAVVNSGGELFNDGPGPPGGRLLQPWRFP